MRKNQILITSRRSFLRNFSHDVALLTESPLNSQAIMICFHLNNHKYVVAFSAVETIS